MNPLTRATVTAVAATAIATGGMLGVRWLAIAVLATSFVLAIGWPVLTWTPQWITSSVVVLGTGSLATIGVLLGRDEPFLRHMVVALAVGVIATLVLEVIRPSPQGQVLTGVAGTISGATVAASGAAWIAAARTPVAEELVIAGAVALAIAAVASVLTTKIAVNSVLAIASATGFGIASERLFESITWYGGALIGFLSASSFLAIHELTRRDTNNTSMWAGIASGITPVTVGGALVYIGGRILVV